MVQVENSHIILTGAGALNKVIQTRYQKKVLSSCMIKITVKIFKNALSELVRCHHTDKNGSIPKEIYYK